MKKSLLLLGDRDLLINQSYLLPAWIVWTQIWIISEVGRWKWKQGVLRLQRCTIHRGSCKVDKGISTNIIDFAQTYHIEPGDTFITKLMPAFS